MKRSELKATCLSCGSDELVLVFDPSVGQCWILICFPLKRCEVKAKVMVTMFALVVFI